MVKFLRIALWNANGLIQRKEEVKLFLVENFIDILLINETHFTAESYIYIPITNYILQITQMVLHTEEQLSL